MANLLNNNSTDDELKINDMEARILQRTTLYKVPNTLSKEDALRRLKMRIETGIPSKEIAQLNRTRIIYMAIVAAASVLLVLGIWQIWFAKPMVEMAINKGQHSECQLPDGSLVTLNADSKISYRENKFNHHRFLKLDGEAFFNVKKGKPFTISTKLADIKILGTSFNVFARNNSFKVSCVTGKISVSTNKQVLIITPGQSAEIQNGMLEKFEDKNIKMLITWQKGEFYFENASLNTVFQEIERQFNVNFVGEKMDNRYFTGSFKNKNLLSTLDIICIPMGLTYEIGSNGKIYIRE